MSRQRKFLAAAGVLVVSLSSGVAYAQQPPGQAATHHASQPQSPAASPASGPRYVLQMNNLDEFGRPRPISIDDIRTRIGEDGVQQLIRDDRNRCNILVQTTEQERRIRAAEQELRDAERELAQAETDQARRVAERRRNRARLNLLDILLGIGSVALAIPTGGASLIGYTGMVALNQGQSQIRRIQGDRDARLWYEQMQLYGQRLGLVDERLNLYDLRMQLTSVRGEFWDSTMLRYCREHVQPYDIRSVNVSFNGGTSAALENNPRMYAPVNPESRRRENDFDGKSK